MQLVGQNDDLGRVLIKDAITLRPPRAGDAEARYLLGQDPAIIRMFGCDPTSLPPWTRERAFDWVADIQSHSCAWIIEQEGSLAGSIRLDDIDLHHRRARLGIGLVHASQLGQGIGRGAISTLLDHAFGAMELHRVYLRVIEYNTRAISCYQSCGFRREGVERQSARVGSTWHDDILMAKLAQDHLR